MRAADRGTGTARVGLLYTGGLIGPLGGSLVNAMLPELADAFDTSVDTAGLSVSAFLFPFALMLLGAGRLADRLGPRRTLLTGYAGYAVASVICVLAPHISVFLAARAVQGMANALVTPVLISVLASAAAPGRLGRTLGLFGSVQAAGQASAPALGGLAAEADWRLAFLAVAATATLLGVTGTHAVRAPDPHRVPHPRGETAQDAASGEGSGAGAVHEASGARAAKGRSGAGAAKGRSGARAANGRTGAVSGRASGARSWGLVMPSAVATCSYTTFIGVLLMAALVAADRFDASPSARGAIVATVGIAGLASGFAVGHLVDRIGPRRCGMVAGLVLGGSAALASVSGHVALLVGAMALTGVAGTAMRASTNVLALSGSGGGSRTGGTSVVLGFQFLGGALAPLLWLPLYGLGDSLALVGCGSGGLLAALLLLVSDRRAAASAAAPGTPGGAAGTPRPGQQRSHPARTRTASNAPRGNSLRVPAPGDLSSTP